MTLQLLRLRRRPVKPNIMTKTAVTGLGSEETFANLSVSLHGGRESECAVLGSGDNGG